MRARTTAGTMQLRYCLTKIRPIQKTISARRVMLTGRITSLCARWSRDTKRGFEAGFCRDVIGLTPIPTMAVPRGLAGGGEIVQVGALLLNLGGNLARAKNEGDGGNSHQREADDFP
ncbi:hypothetical protein KKB28_07125, partial [bacterium]|nr:hypothetical protein [bacterium]